MDFTKCNKVLASFQNAKKDLPFLKIEDVEIGEIYKVNGIFFVNGKFGKRYFVSLEKGDNFFNFDLPTNQNDIAENLIHDKDSVSAINRGECGVKINKYFNKKFNKECVNIEWCNIDTLVY